MGIRIKRAYTAPLPTDGYRVLVDRLWPRGLSRRQLRLHSWLPDVAPSNSLRRWYSHDPAKWPEFKRRYFTELRSCQDAVQELVALARKGTLTLVFSSREQKFNNAAALKEYISRRTHGRGRDVEPA